LKWADAFLAECRRKIRRESSESELLEMKKMEGVAQKSNISSCRVLLPSISMKNNATAAFLALYTALSAVLRS